MILFINAQREAYGVEPIGAVLPIAPSTYHLGKARGRDPDRLPAGAKRDAKLRPEIERVRKDSFEVDGVRKVWRLLKRDDVKAARCTVVRLMGELGLRGVVRGRKAKTTLRAASVACPAGWVQRTFTGSRPNALWV